MLRAGIRRVFAHWQLLPLMDNLHFHLSALRYMRSNRRFLAAHPDFAFPPARMLHETYRLDYSDYAVDGEETARELIDRCRPFLSRVPIDVLEWGCGVARLTRHLPPMPDVRSVTGVDVNPRMINWARAHIPGVAFHEIGHKPPTPFVGESFDLVLAVSVFTHIPAEAQSEWFEEIRRVLRPGGLFLFTTQGRFFRSKLTLRERSIFDKHGYLTRDYPQMGHRMMSTFQEAGFVSRLLQGRFDLLDYVDGSNDHAAAGGPDLWLVRRHG
jgi:SAM-dependent methyltransferase